MASRSRRAAVATFAALHLVIATASAQDPSDMPPSTGDPATAQTGIDLVQKRLYWASSAGERLFLSTLMEAGPIYFRPTVALGYGRPHWSWIGVEGYSSVAPSGAAEYLGLRAALPRLEVRGGVRYAFSTVQYFLRPDDSYTREETELKVGPQSRYAAAEIEILGSLPLLGATLFGIATGYGIFATPPDFYVFEEALHTVAKPPFLYRARLGLIGPLDRYGDLRLGAAAEIIGNPGRDSTIFRIGPVLSVTLTHHLDAIGSIMVVAATPDQLGLLGADLGQLGVRYRWATGDRWPEFP